jgi:hypothetical protein
MQREDPQSFLRAGIRISALSRKSSSGRHDR